MARIRTLKPEFWTDEKLALLPPLTRLVFLGLISQADDAGRLVDNVKLLDGLLFPYTDDSCGEALDELAKMGRVVRYRSESGQPLVQLANWEKHQKVKNPSKYNLPAPSPERVPPTSVESGESRGRVGGESNAPIPDPRSSTPDHLPPTAEPREPDGDGDHRAACERYVEARGYGARERLIAQGEDATAWNTPTGDRVPWSDRLRLLKLADGRVQDRESQDLRSALRYVIPQQYDPTKAPTAADFAARKQASQPAQQSAPRPQTVDELQAKRDAAAAEYSRWRDVVLARLRAEPPDTREAIQREAEAVLGDALKCLPTTARPRTLEAKALEIYGERIGNPQPRAA